MAKALRVPVFKPGTSTEVKAAQLEDYMLLSAYVLGDLHEERLDLHTQLKPLREQWRDIEGWELLRQGRTDSSVNAAKAIMEPELDAQMDDLHWRIARLTEEINRLDRDATKASRAYSMLTGA